MHAGPHAAGVGEDRPDAGILERADQCVAMLRGVVDLGDIDDAGRTHVDHSERRRQHPGISVGGRKRRRQRADDVAIVVGVDPSVGQDVAQNALIGVAVGVDEAGNDDLVRRIDHRHVVRHHDVRPDLADLAVLDQHVCLRKVADLPVERQHHARLQQDAALPPEAAEFRIPLGNRPLRQGLGGHHAGREACARS